MNESLPAPFDLLPPLLEGLRVTLRLTSGAAVVAVLAAFVAGIGRCAESRWLRWPARTYIEVFRGTSALVQLFWFFYALPFLGVELGPLSTGIVVLGLNVGAYGAEVVRGALDAVPKGQLEAARALSFDRRQTFLRIVLPQAVPRMLPPFGNLSVELLKNTALVSMITLAELTFRGQILQAATLRTMEIYAVVLVLYYLVAKLFSWTFRALEERYRVETV